MNPDEEPSLGDRHPDRTGDAPTGEGLTRLTLDLVGGLLEAADPLRDMAERGLRKLVDGLGAERAVLVFTSGDGQALPSSHVVWANPVDETEFASPLSAMENATDSPSTWRRLDQYQTVAITDVAELPESWAADRAYLEALHVRSSARAPLVCEGRTIGTLGIDMVSEPRRWSDDELAALRLVAGVLGGAMARQRSEAKLHERDALFRALVDYSSDLLVIVTAEGEARFVSPAVEHLFGYTPDELLGHSFLTVLHQEDLERVLERFMGVISTGVGGDPMLLRVRHKDGRWRWVEAVGTNLLDDPDVGAILVNLREVTERLEAERAIAAERERYRLLVESMPDHVIKLDSQLRPVYGNPAAHAVHGAWLDGRAPGPAGYGEDADRRAFTSAELHRVITTGQPNLFEIMLELPDGDRWFQVTVLPEFSDDDEREVTGLLTVSRDINVYKEREEELTLRALEDPLTGLANRTLFEAELERALHGLARNKAPVGVLFLDLDGFKSINDAHGHTVGDRFLVEFARRLQTAVRPSDLVARIGGDEFIVLPDRLHIVAELGELAERLHAALQQPILLEGHELSATVSIGMAVVTEPGRVDAAALIDRADQAMYRSKRLGRSQTSMWRQAD